MIEVLIERTLNGKYVVSEALIYSTIIKTPKTKHRGFNLFGENLGTYETILENHEIRYKAGDALTSSHSYEECLMFITKNKLELIKQPLHTSFLTELHSRYFR